MNDKYMPIETFIKEVDIEILELTNGASRAGVLALFRKKMETTIRAHYGVMQEVCVASGFPFERAVEQEELVAHVASLVKK